MNLTLQIDSEAKKHSASTTQVMNKQRQTKSGVHRLVHRFSEHFCREMKPIIFLVLFVISSPFSQADEPKFTWIKYQGTPGGAGYSDGSKTEARFRDPTSLWVDGSNTAHILDDPGHPVVINGTTGHSGATIRQVSPSGARVTTLAELTDISNIFVDSGGTIYADGGTDDNGLSVNQVVSPSGQISTWRTPGIYSKGIVKDAAGNIFFISTSSYSIWKQTPAGVESVFAGSNTSSGSLDGTGSSARFNQANGLTIDAYDNIYVIDQSGSAIRKISPARVVTTLASSPATFTGSISSIAWGPVSGISGGCVYFVDPTTMVVRRIPANPAAGTTITQLAVSGTYRPHLIATDISGRLYIMDESSAITNTVSLLISWRLRRFTPSSTSTYTLDAAYGAVGGSKESGGFSNSAPIKFNAPEGVAASSLGDLYVADTDNGKIRKITTGGVVSTYAGNGTIASIDNSTVRTSASFEYPNSIAISAAGDAYVADQSAIRRIKATGSSGLVKTLFSVTYNTPADLFRGIAVSGNPVNLVFFGKGHEIWKSELTNAATDTWTTSIYYSGVVGNAIQSLCIDSNSLYAGIDGVTSSPAGGIKKMAPLNGTPGTVETILAWGPSADSTQSQPAGSGTPSGLLAMDSKVYFTNNHAVRVLLPPGTNPSFPSYTGWTVETVGGPLTDRYQGFAVDSVGIAGQLNDVGSLAAFGAVVGLTGQSVNGTTPQLFISDISNHSIFKGVVSGPVITANTPAVVAPALPTAAAVTTATVSATIIPQASAPAISSTILEYGVTTDYGSTAITTSSSTTGVRIDSATLNGLMFGKAYHYRFKVTMAGTPSVSYYSEDCVLGTPTGPVITNWLASMTSATATLLSNTLEIAATTSYTSAGIEIQRSTDNVTFTSIATVPVAANATYVDSVAPSNTTQLSFYYRSRVVLGAYASAWTNVLQLTQPAWPSISSFYGTITSTTATSMSISLNVVSGSIYSGKSYEIQRSADNVTFTTIAAAIPDTQAMPYLDASPLNGGSYFYRSRVKVGSGTGLHTSAWSTTYQAQQPAWPVATLSANIIAASDSELTILLNTGTTSTFTGVSIELERSVNNTSFTNIWTSPPSPPSSGEYTDTVSLTTSSTYYYRARAVVGTGSNLHQSGWTTSVQVSRPNGPSVTTSLSQVTNTTIPVQWSYGVYEGKFEIQRSDGGAAFVTIASIDAPAFQYVDTPTSTDINYTYRVRYTRPNYTTAWGPASVAFTRTVPSTPTVSTSPGVVFISTNANAILAAERSSDGVNFAPVTLVYPCRDYSIPAVGVYTYKIRFSQSGSLNSNPILVTANVTMSRGRIFGSSANDGNGVWGNTLTINNSNFSVVITQRKVGSGAWLPFSGQVVPYADSPISPGTTYRYIAHVEAPSFIGPDEDVVIPATNPPLSTVSVTVKANSDAVVSIPFLTIPQYTGKILSVTGNTITVVGSPNWSWNNYATATWTSGPRPYAVIIQTGSKEGLMAKITANTANSITVALPPGEDLTGVGDNFFADSIAIIPYQAVNDVFGATPVGTQILGFQSAGAGTNLGASELFSHTDVNVWEDGINGGIATLKALPFGGTFIIRNNSTSDFVWTRSGYAPGTAIRQRLVTLAANTDQDQYFGLMAAASRPLATTVNPNALGMPLADGDQILMFDNNATGINKSAALHYVWNSGTWYDQDTSAPVTTAVTLQPGVGYIFRKAATPAPANVAWSYYQ